MGGWFKRAEASLAGWPDTAVTVALLVAAGVIVFIALAPRLPRLVKIAALAYVALP